MIHNTSRPDSGFVQPFGGGGNGNRIIFPVNEINARRMSPMNRAPERSIWIVLVKEMVLPLPENRAVWIIHPIRWRQEMIKRSVRVGGKRLARRAKCSSPVRIVFLGRTAHSAHAST